MTSLQTMKSIQISVKTNHNTAFCDEELKFDTVKEKALKCKTGYRAKYY